MEGITMSVEPLKKEQLKKFTKTRFPRKLKKEVKKAWKFRNDGFVTHVTFKPILTTHLGRRVQKMIKVTGEGLKLPLWDGKYLCMK